MSGRNWLSEGNKKSFYASETSGSDGIYQVGFGSSIVQYTFPLN
jgi:hypothetical protein